MHPERISFSVHDYDSDGDISERGVFLHFGDTRVKAADSIKEFRSILRHFESIVNEIESNYQD
jgi:hypothetical protein